jgi:hypothetical protein
MIEAEKEGVVNLNLAILMATEVLKGRDIRVSS